MMSFWSERKLPRPESARASPLLLRKAFDYACVERARAVVSLRPRFRASRAKAGSSQVSIRSPTARFLTLRTMAPDLNVLLAASRSDHPHHTVALDWLNRALVDCEDGESLEILPMVAAGFLRLATHPKVFKVPTPIGGAIAFIDALLARPGVQMPEIGREWPSLKQLAREHALVANDLTDAWIAAAVRTIGSHLVTFDRGFKRLLIRNELTVLEPQSR